MSGDGAADRVGKDSVGGGGDGRAGGGDPLDDQGRMIPALALKLFGASVEMSHQASNRVIENERANAKREKARAERAERDLFYVVAVQRMLADPRYAKRLFQLLDRLGDEEDDAVEDEKPAARGSRKGAE